MTHFPYTEKNFANLLFLVLNTKRWNHFSNHGHNFQTFVPLARIAKDFVVVVEAAHVEVLQVAEARLIETITTIFSLKIEFANLIWPKQKSLDFQYKTWFRPCNCPLIHHHSVRFGSRFNYMFHTRSLRRSPKIIKNSVFFRTDHDNRYFSGQLSGQSCFI